MLVECPCTLRRSDLLGLLGIVSALAGPASAEPSFQKGAPKSDATPTAHREVSVVLVSRVPRQTELRALIAELLERQDISVEFAAAGRFEAQALFARSQGDRRVHVYLVIHEKQARLYFRGPGGKRFLLRKLALPGGLDEVGRELVAQVVESATRVLLYSSAGLSRAEANSEVERIEHDASAPLDTDRHGQATAPLRIHPAPTTRPAASDAPAFRRFALELGLRYAGHYTGPQTGVWHGPGAELGLTYVALPPFRLRAGIERYKTKTLHLEGVEAREQAWSFRASIDLGLPLVERRLALMLSLGGGADHVRWTPRAVSSTITPGHSGSSWVPALRAELRCELRLGHLWIAAGPFMDWSLSDSYYELLDESGRSRVAAPWTAHPGGTLAVGARL